MAARYTIRLLDYLLGNRFELYYDSVTMTIMDVVHATMDFEILSPPLPRPSLL